MIRPCGATVLLGWDAEGGNLPALLHLVRAWGKKLRHKIFFVFQEKTAPSPSRHEIRAENAS